MWLLPFQYTNTQGEQVWRIYVFEAINCISENIFLFLLLKQVMFSCPTLIDHSIFSVHSYSMRKSPISEVDGYNSDVVMIGNDDSDIVDDDSISGDGGGGSDG